MLDTSAFDSLDIGVCVRTPTLHVTMQNDACLKICGLQAGDVCKRVGFRTCSSREIAEATAEGTYRLPMQASGSARYDVLVVHRDAKIVTLLCPSPDHRSAELREAGLTRREAEIAVLSEAGLGRAQIAAELRLSENTVKTHVRHARQKLARAGMRLRGAASV